jgi:hypothetical protein
MRPEWIPPTENEFLFAAVFIYEYHSSLFCDFSNRSKSHVSNFPRQEPDLAQWNGEKQFVVVAAMERQPQRIDGSPATAMP